MVTSRWRRSPLLTSTPERSVDHVPSFGMQRLTAVTATGTEGPGNADLFAVLKLASGGRATTTHQPASSSPVYRRQEQVPHSLGLLA